jgi:hypothetical protein
VRDIATDLLGGLLLLLQLNSYGFNVSATSPESYDLGLAKELYDWTEKAVQSSSK